MGSCSRRKAALATTDVVQALEIGPDVVQQLRDLGKGYSALKDVAPPTPTADEVIETVVDQLPLGWPCAATRPPSLPTTYAMSGRWGPWPQRPSEPFLTMSWSGPVAMTSSRVAMGLMS